MIHARCTLVYDHFAFADKFIIPAYRYSFSVLVPPPYAEKGGGTKQLINDIHNNNDQNNKLTRECHRTNYGNISILMHYLHLYGCNNNKKHDEHMNYIHISIQQHSLNSLSINVTMKHNI